MPEWKCAIFAVFIFNFLTLTGCAPSIRSINAKHHDFEKSDLPIVYGRIKVEGKGSGDFLVRRNIIGFVNTTEGKFFSQIDYFNPDDSGYFVHQVRPGKMRIGVYEERIVFNPEFPGPAIVDRVFRLRNGKAGIDLKNSSANYIGTITLNRDSMAIEVEDEKTDADDWLLSKSKFFDGSKSIKNIPQDK